MKCLPVVLPLSRGPGSSPLRGHCVGAGLSRDSLATDDSVTGTSPGNLQPLPSDPAVALAPVINAILRVMAKSSWVAVMNRLLIVSRLFRAGESAGYVGVFVVCPSAPCATPGSGVHELVGGAAQGAGRSSGERQLNRADGFTAAKTLAVPWRLALGWPLRVARQRQPPTLRA